MSSLEQGNSGMYCIGTNKRTSVNEIYRQLCEITGFNAPIVRAPKRPGDARDAQFDYALAKSELGWEPRTQLRDGIRETYEYFKDALPVSK